MQLCKEYLKGNCRNGPKCRFLHDPCRKNRSLCRAFIRGYCVRVGVKRGSNEGSEVQKAAQSERSTCLAEAENGGGRWSDRVLK